MKRKWFAYIVAILGVGLTIQLTISYALQRMGAGYGAKVWFKGSATAGVRVAHRAMSGELSAIAERIATSPGFPDGPGLDLARRVEDELSTRGKGRGFWALVDERGAVRASSSPGCAARIERRVLGGSWTGGPVVRCGEDAFYTAFHSTSGAGLVVGLRMDDVHAAEAAEVTNTEIVLLVGGAQRGTSLRARNGAPVAFTLDEAAIREAHATRTVAFRSDGRVAPGYRGYPSSGGELIPVRSFEHWYYGAYALSDADDDVVIVLVIPVSFMLKGARYSTTATAIVSIGMLVITALLIRRLVDRFTTPLAALTSSASAVAAGDLTQVVPLPADAEMREFCKTYNGMLGSMRELLELRQRVAREAGMADIANGVLHNIGNVLNNVSVSISLAIESTKCPHVAGLGKLSKLVDRHEADLAEFLTEDPRGRKVPEYLRTVATELEKERDHLARELVNASESVDHLKRIVGAQQRYARPAGLVERCTVDEVVNDALRMSATSFSSHEIEIDTRGLRPVELRVDRHRLLQIVINLLTNAKESLVERAGRPSETGLVKRIVLKSERVEGGRVRLFVEDNGGGIAPEHRSRMFTQGFTTKAHGHGIGLHNCALLATEMGGYLSFWSAGRGHGATFTLELPLEPPSRVAAPRMAIPPTSLQPAAA